MHPGRESVEHASSSHILTVDGQAPHFFLIRDNDNSSVVAHLHSLSNEQ